MQTQEKFWQYFDFIHNNGSDSARVVMCDAVLAWSLLKPGGILAFENYAWERAGHPDRCPKAGIDAFAEGHKSALVMLREGQCRIWQKTQP